MISVRSSVSMSECRYPHPDSDLFHVVGQVFCHPLRQRRHEYLIPCSRLLIDLSDQIVNLSLYRTHLDLRIQQPGRADDLLLPAAARAPPHTSPGVADTKST